MTLWASDAPLEALLGSEPLRRLGALMAVDADGRLRGVVTLEQVSRRLAEALLEPATGICFVEVRLTRLGRTSSQAPLWASHLGS